MCLVNWGYNKNVTSHPNDSCIVAGSCTRIYIYKQILIYIYARIYIYTYTHHLKRFFSSIAFWICELFSLTHSCALPSQEKPLFLNHVTLCHSQNIKGQLGVPLTVYPWYLLCSLGILGDYNPWISTIYGYIGISHRGYVGRGTSNYPLRIDLETPGSWCSHGWSCRDWVSERPVSSPCALSRFSC